MEPMANSLAGVLSRNSLLRSLPTDPQERQTWLAENASVLAESGCAHCGGELPPEAVREHLCCRCGDAGRYRNADRTVSICVCRLTGVPEREFLRRSGIPATMAYTLDGAPPRFREIATRYAETMKPHVLFLTGTVGSGKTGLACAILRELWLRQSKVGRFMVAPELIRRFQATFGDATESKEDIHRELDLAPLVVLDDYGTEKATEFAAAEMFRLINHRHSEGKGLIVTTNLDPLSLDPRLKSRLTDTERSVWLQFTGPDRRVS